MDFFRLIDDNILNIVSRSSAKTETNRLQLVSFLWVHAISYVILPFFILYCLVFGEYSSFLFLSFYMFFSIGLIYLIRMSYKLFYMYMASNILFFILMICLVLNANTYVVLWAYVYSLISIFLFGSKKGTWWSLGLLIILVAIMGGQSYEFEFIIEFIVSYVLCIGGLYFFKSYDERKQRKQKNLKKQVLSLGQELKENMLEKQEVQELLEQMTYTDSLTNLINRRHFWYLGNKEVVRSIRYDVPMCLAILDIDDFKNINSTCGHPAGDEVLRVLSRHCTYVLRESDILGRIGGEEFAFLLVHIDKDKAYEKFEALRKEIEGLNLKILENRAKFTVSIGLSSLSSDEESLDDLYQKADDALSKAKNSGKNRVILL